MDYFNLLIVKVSLVSSNVDTAWCYVNLGNSGEALVVGLIINDE